MTVAEWLQKLLDLLCELYKRWGGKCEDLETDPADRVMQLNSHYQTEGPPPTSEHPKTIEVLDALDAHLADPANSLNQNTIDVLKDLIAALRNDCQP